MKVNSHDFLFILLQQHNIKLYHEYIFWVCILSFGFFFHENQSFYHKIQFIVHLNKRTQKKGKQNQYLIKMSDVVLYEAAFLTHHKTKYMFKMKIP